MVATGTDRYCGRQHDGGLPQMNGSHEIAQVYAKLRAQFPDDPLEEYAQVRDDCFRALGLSEHGHQ